jgi:hypothetical protein
MPPVATSPDLAGTGVHPELAGRCFQCAQFRNAPEQLERDIAGLISMSSGFAAVRWNDGLCLLHERYLTARSSCAQFRAAGRASKI